jgi:hypothetical protein
LARRRRADADAFVGEAHVHRVGRRSEWTATVEMPISLQARWTRSAISPRLAMRTFSNIAVSNLPFFSEGLSAMSVSLSS